MENVEKGLTAKQIRGLLTFYDSNLQKIADNFGFSKQYISACVNRINRDKRIRQYIAEILDIDYHKIWGEYPP